MRDQVPFAFAVPADPSDNTGPIRSTSSAPRNCPALWTRPSAATANETVGPTRLRSSPVRVDTTGSLRVGRLEGLVEAREPARPVLREVRASAARLSSSNRPRIAGSAAAIDRNTVPQPVPVELLVGGEAVLAAALDLEQSPDLDFGEIGSSPMRSAAGRHAVAASIPIV